MAKNYIVNSNRFNFAEAVHEVLNANWYQDGVIPAMNEAIDEVAKEAVRKLKSGSPRRSGKYARNWTYQKDKARITVGAVVYGKKPTYRLAHLLEFPHLMRNGKRSKPEIHIEPVADWVQTETLNRMYEKLEKLYR